MVMFCFMALHFTIFGHSLFIYLFYFTTSAMDKMNISESL